MALLQYILAPNWNGIWILDQFSNGIQNVKILIFRWLIVLFEYWNNKSLVLIYFWCLDPHCIKENIKVHWKTNSYLEAPVSFVVTTVGKVGWSHSVFIARNSFHRTLQQKSKTFFTSNKKFLGELFSFRLKSIST